MFFAGGITCAAKCVIFRLRNTHPDNLFARMIGTWLEIRVREKADLSAFYFDRKYTQSLSKSTRKWRLFSKRRKGLNEEKSLPNLRAMRIFSHR